MRICPVNMNGQVIMLQLDDADYEAYQRAGLIVNEATVEKTDKTDAKKVEPRNKSVDAKTK